MAFEQARNLQAVTFDKTVTLTERTFNVTDILNFNDKFSNDEIRLYAWGVIISSAMGAVLISASTVMVVINARLLKMWD